MTDETTEQLIALVRSRPVLWDKSSDRYRHVLHTKCAWAEVCRKLNEGYDSMKPVDQEAFSRDIIKKWTNLRDAMVKSIKKNRRYIYGELLQFVARQYETDPLEEDEKEIEDESKNSQQCPIEVNSEKMIACIEKWPCLWDKSLATYKDRTHNKSAWLEVVRELNPDFDQLEVSEQEHYRREIVKKWNNTRDTFAKSLKKTSGPPFRARKYVYADQLHFLRRFYASYDDPGDEEWRIQEMGHQSMDVADPLDVVLDECVEETVTLPTWDPQVNFSSLIQEKPALQESGNPGWETQSLVNPKKRKYHEKRQQQLGQHHLEPDEVDQRILGVLDRLEPDNRHMSFFKGIIPSLKNFDEDEVLQFQMQVLQIISDIRKQRKENSTDVSSKPHENKTTNKPLVKSEVIMSAYLSEQSSNSSE